ncbi:MAG: PEP/pyruvate-binding domain-containing protein [Myxococcota bacterium]|nr:PEP/pyruvate-binding domain-containing protein [Myxococcota bacterium]
MKIESMILGPEAALDAGEPQVGGKAFGLARLKATGVCVPPWRVITADACLTYLRESPTYPSIVQVMDGLAELNPQDRAHRQHLEAVSQRIRDDIAASPVPFVNPDQPPTWLQALGPGPFAVRSSMVGEDSASHSFAGQLDSYLFQSVGDLNHAIVNCWASAFSVHALLYRHQAGLDALPAVAVVVQAMLSGHVSGVAFTAHPVNGRRDHMLISGAWGQGEGVVNGLCNADEYVWSGQTGEVSSVVVTKDVMVVPRAKGQPGTDQQAVPERQQRQRCLTVEQVDQLGACLLRIQAHFDRPMDVEWTWVGEELNFLQARPITSLPPEPDLAAPLVVFDNSNIQESYCGVTTPLTFSFAQRAYASVYAQTMQAAGLSAQVIADHDDMLRNMLALVKGRVFYNINNWYRGLLILPGFGKNKADMERMMGLEDPVDFVQDTQLTRWEKIQRMPSLFMTLVRLLNHFRRLPKTVPAWLERFETLYGQIDRDGLKTAPLSRLMATLERLDRQMLGQWHIPILNDFYVMMSVGKLRRALSKGAVDDPDDLINRLLAGEEDIESTQPVRRLLQIADRVRQDEEATQILTECDAVEAVEALRQHDGGLRTLIDEYIERYGDRSMGELKLETVTLRADTRFMARVLKGYLGRPDLGPDVLSQKEKAIRFSAERDMEAARPKHRVRAAQRALSSSRRAVKNREAMRLARTRMFGLYRAVYTGIGRVLHAHGRLHHPRDVFYLTVEDIRADYEGRSANVHLAEIARVRAAEFEAYTHEDVPHRIEARAPVYQNMPAFTVSETEVDRDARILRGIGCYPGTVDGEVRIIRSPDDELSVDGQILTALRTDPGWAPLFPTCRGLLVERGSTLSHSAVVARELGIPAVVGIPHLLASVETGDRVRLDGQQGTVLRHDLSSDSDGVYIDG